MGRAHGFGDPSKDVRRIAKPDVTVIHISGDAQPSLPPLVAAVKRELTSTRAAALAQKADRRSRAIS